MDNQQISTKITGGNRDEGGDGGRILGVPRTDKMTNKEYLIKTNEERDLINFIRIRQSSIIELKMRRKGLENIKLAGKINGKRDRGRPREKKKQK